MTLGELATVLEALGAASLPPTLPPLVGFLLGYAAILAVPGPNLIAVSAVAALRGMRGALPLCLGVALGAGALGTAICAAVGAAARLPGMADELRLLGALLLLGVAASLAWPRRPPAGAEGGAAPKGAVAFGAGFCTAASNPLTGSFFASAFAGPLLEAAPNGPGTLALALFGIVSTALGFFLAVAALLARPAARRAALVWHRPIRLAAAAMLTVMAAESLLRAGAG